MFSKEDIKPGMLVELSVCGEKKLYYVTLCKEGMVLVDKKGLYRNLECFNNDLSRKISDKVEITKVYDLSEYACTSLEFSTEDRKLLWKMEDKTDWNKVEVDTKVLVRDKSDGEWVKRYFAKYEDSKVYVFKDGRTSWNNEGITQHWKETKLWKDNN